MSDIGGVSANQCVRGQRGSAYGEYSNVYLEPEVFETFVIIADKIAQKDILAEMKSNDILPIEENGFRAAAYLVGRQPFLLMRPLKDSSESYVFDPVAKTFFGGIGAVYNAIYNKVQRESESIVKIEKGLRDNEGLVAKYAEANSIYLIAKAIGVRQQATHEFLSLINAADRINVTVPHFVRERLAELCELPQQKEEVVVAPCQPSKTGIFAWLARALG